MNQAVQSFIDQKNKEYEAAKTAERNSFYNKFNLSTKVYEDTEEHGKLSSKEKAEKYPFVDYSNGTSRRYRIVYPEFTDLEFETMKKAQERVDEVNSEAKINKENDVSSKGSALATFLLVLAIVIFFAALIIGIEMGNKAGAFNAYSSYSSSRFDLGTASIYWGIGVFSGSVMLGLSDIVDHVNKQTNLLRAILNKQKE